MPFTLVASNSNAGDETSRTTWTVTLPSVTAGTLVALLVKYEGALTTISVSDGTTSATPGTQYSHANGDVHEQWFYYLAHPGSGSTVTLTATFAAGKVYQLLHVWNFSYTGGDCVFDVEAGASGTSSSPSSGNMTTTGSDALVFGGYAPYSEATFSSPLVNGSAADGSKINTPGGTFGASWYKSGSAPFTGPASGTLSGSADWIVSALAFKIDDGGADIALDLGVGAASATGHAPSLEITGDVNLTLGVGSVVATGYAPQVDDGSPAPLATGLSFPGVTGDTAADWLMFGWANGDGASGIDTPTPPLAIYPATFVWRAFPRNSSQFFYSGLFHSEDWANNAFEGSTYDYYGAHPYHNTDILGPGDPRWEIAENGGDQTLYQNGDPATIDFGSYPPLAPSDEGWYTQVLTARKIGSDYEYTFYPHWPDTSESTTIQVSNTAHGVAPHPILCVGDAPWNRGKEIYKGVLRGFQFYDAFLSEADIAAELAAPGSTRTPWYLKLNPTPDDIADESGNGHDPAWVNSNRPSLWAEAAPVELEMGAGAATVTGNALALEISGDVSLSMGVGAVSVAGPAPSLDITADIGLALGVGAVAVAGFAPTLEAPMSPVANFGVSTDDLTVTVTDHSSDADGTIESWAWDWGDESTDDVQSPDPHTYAEPGTYTITLIVTDNDGLTDTKTRAVTVPPATGGARSSRMSLGIGLGLSVLCAVLRR